MLELFKQYYPMILAGFVQTLYASLLGLFFSLLIGTFMGILQTVQHRVVRFLANCYVEFFRNIPLSWIYPFYTSAH